MSGAADETKLKKKKKKAKIGVAAPQAPATAPGKKTAKGKKGKGGSKKEGKDGKQSSAQEDGAKGGPGSSYKQGNDDPFPEGSVDYNSDSGGEDYSDDGEEGEDGYKVGGYHPVLIGDVFNSRRYTVVEKLGWGHFSTVWMTHDKKSEEKKTPEFVAVKIQKSASHYRDAAFDEIELLSCVSKATRSERAVREFGPRFDPCVVTLLDHFEHTGPHGKHVCMVFEMLGENLLKVIQNYNYRGIPIPIVKDMIRQVCVGLDFLHRHCSIIHTDLKPENILIAVAPKPPPPERVASILSMTERQSAAAGGGASFSSSSLGAETEQIEALKKQLEGDKDLNPEQRKKLKKKLKKKRQQAKKKSNGAAGNKDRRGNRRKGTAERKERGDASLEKANKFKDKEMAMMERASLPSVSAEMAAKMLDEAVAPEQGAQAADVTKRLAGLELNLGKLEAKQQQQERDSSEGNGNGSSGMPLVSSSSAGGARDDDASMILPHWARPTLFTFFNFRRSDDAELQLSSRGPVRGRTVNYVEAVRIAEDDWVKPADVMFAKLSLLASTNKMVDAFGPPLRDGGDSELSFAEWHLALRKASYSSRDELTMDASDASLQFVVKGMGFDTEGLFPLVGLCALNAVAFQPDRFVVQIPQSDDDRPVCWSIIHHASVTEHLVAFLEMQLEGVRFLSHYKIPSLLVEEDDEELLFVMQRDCRHPACRRSPNNNRLFAEDKKAGEDEDGEGDGENDRHAPPYLQGQGALLGVDLDSLMASVVGETEVDEAYLASIFDIDAYVRPLDERMRCFVGDAGHLGDSIIEYNALGHALMLAAGELSQDGGSQDGEDDDDADSRTEEQNKPRSARLEALDEVYRNVRVKIVDLGNACWTYKHFTDDIQTRQYRAPEVLLGAPYDTSADMWSLACIVFELVTGELLFDPRAGKSWDREEDHLAMMIELLGPFPPKVVSTGKNCSDYFNKRGELRHIHQLKFWGLRDVLHDKYKLPEREAAEMAAFLVPMLEVDPEKRATAFQCLQHPWVGGKGEAGAQGKGEGGGSLSSAQELLEE